MAVLKIRTFPDPLLRSKAQPISQVTEEVRQFARDMLETLYASNGIGLAANQVGVLQQLIVIDTRPSVSEPTQPEPSDENLASPEMKKNSEKTSSTKNDIASHLDDEGVKRRNVDLTADSQGQKKSQKFDAEDREDREEKEDEEGDDETSSFRKMSELEKQIEQPLYLINPVLIESFGKTSYQEGCLSVPTFYETVQRKKEVTIEYSDLNGNKKSLRTDGLLAICIQHEMDHLAGKLFIDRLSFIKSSRIKSNIMKNGYPPHPNDEEEEEDADDLPPPNKNRD